MSDEKCLDDKIFMISDTLEIKKSEKDKYYKFYNFENLLSLLKPMLKELNLLLRFKNGIIEGNRYVLFLELKDLETGEILEDSDSSLIDLNNKVMSLPQSVNVTKTFLKKNMINNLFNIKEPDQPDPKKPLPTFDKVTDVDIKRFYAVFMQKFSKETLETKIKSMINEAYNVKHKREIPRQNFIDLIKYAEKNKADIIENALKRKIEKK